MNRLRKLIATALLAIPVLAFSAAAPATGANAGTTLAATPSAAHCTFIYGQWYCF